MEYRSSGVPWTNSLVNKCLEISVPLLGLAWKSLWKKNMNLAVWSTKPMVTGPNVYFDILFFVCIPVPKKRSGTNEDSSWMPSTKNEHRASCQWNPGTGIPSKSKAILLLLSMDKIQPTGL